MGARPDVSGLRRLPPPASGAASCCTASRRASRIRSRRRRIRSTSRSARCCRWPASTPTGCSCSRRCSASSRSSPAPTRSAARCSALRRPSPARSSSARASRSCSTPCARSSTCRSSRSSCGRRRWRCERPRRGLAPLALLAAAGLLRPEAWVLAGLYWLWCLPGSTTRARAGLLALVARRAARVVLVDLAVTGDPLFSLTNTQALSDTLDRERGLGNVPAHVRVVPRRSRAPAGRARRGRRPRPRAAPLRRRGGWRSRSRSSAPASLTFVAIGVAGLSLIPRYLTVPAVALCVLAGYARARLHDTRAGARARRAGARWRSARSSSASRSSSSSWRASARCAASCASSTARTRRSALSSPIRACATRMRCGPLTFPTYRLVPDARWLLDRDARADPHARRRLRRRPLARRRRRLHRRRREVRAALRARRRRVARDEPPPARASRGRSRPVHGICRVPAASSLVSLGMATLWRPLLVVATLMAILS